MDRNENAASGGNAPAKLAYVPEKVFLGLEVGNAAGTLEAYGCQECGYVEYYLKELLPIDGKNVMHVQGPRQQPA